jgi:hypothetical protein
VRKSLNFEEIDLSASQTFQEKQAKNQQSQGFFR